MEVQPDNVTLEQASDYITTCELKSYFQKIVLTINYKINKDKLCILGEKIKVGF